MLGSINVDAPVVFVVGGVVFLVVVGYACGPGPAAGSAIGGVVGYLLRPSLPLVGQLPFETVITRGSGLRGINELQRSTAEVSFNYSLAGALIGGTLLGVVQYVVRRRAKDGDAGAPEK